VKSAKNIWEAFLVQALGEKKINLKSGWSFLLVGRRESNLGLFLIIQSLSINLYYFCVILK